MGIESVKTGMNGSGVPLALSVSLLLAFTCVQQLFLSGSGSHGLEGRWVLEKQPKIPHAPLAPVLDLLRSTSQPCDVDGTQLYMEALRNCMTWHSVLCPVDRRTCSSFFSTPSKDKLIKILALPLLIIR